MPENKREITRRLQDDGRWKAFCVHKEDVKAAHPDMGAKEFWALAAEAFPPTEAEEKDILKRKRSGKKLIMGRTQDELDDIFQILKEKETGKATYAKDVIWVYNNMIMEFEDIELEDAPGRGALSLLQTAKKDADLFWKMFEKLSPNKRELDGAASLIDRTADVTSILDELGELAKQVCEGEQGGLEGTG